MTRFYQGITMAVIILSAGIIGQIDSANERSVKRAMRTETVRHEQASDQQSQRLEGKTVLARINERWSRFH